MRSALPGNRAEYDNPAIYWSRGFERYYGFMGGETNQWYPELTYDNHEVEQPKQPEEGYHLSSDLADKAIEFIQDAHVNAPDKPFFLYYATGAGHAPHHVPKEWADKYKGKFDMGWDEYRKVVHQRQLEMGIIPPGTELSAHDPDVPVWDTLSGDAKRLYARYMEVFAGFVSFTDHHFGRILQFLAEIGELENTLIIVISDNGASAEGGPVGSLNEMFFFNNVAESLEDNLKMIDELGGAEGVLMAQGGRTGGRTGGYTFFVKQQRLYFLYNFLGRDRFWLKSDALVPEGEVELRYEFEPTGKPDVAQGHRVPARGQLYINRKLVASIDMPFSILNMFGTQGLTCGYDGGEPAAPEEYRQPFRFTGTIKRVTVDLSGELISDTEADMKIAMMRQ